MDTVYITCIIYLRKGETEFYLGKHTCFVCVCVTCCSPQQGHLCARFALGAALGHLANGLFRNWESQTHQTHFKLAYIDLALNHFEPSWLWIHTRKKHKSTPKEHQNSLRKFAIWGSQFSELWPWWMILQQSQIHFFIFYQSELSQVSLTWASPFQGPKPMGSRGHNVTGPGDKHEIWMHKLKTMESLRDIAPIRRNMLCEKIN